MQISGKAPNSNHVFVNFYATRVFSLMSRFKSINFHQKMAKTKLFLQINKNFRMLGAPSPEPQWPITELPDPQNSPGPPLQVFGYALDTKRVLRDAVVVVLVAHIYPHVTGQRKTL